MVSAVRSPLLRPRWLVAHVVLLAVLWTFVSLGLWQLRRLDERDASNALISSRIEAPVGDASTLTSPTGDHRRVRLTGTYLVEHETILLSRSRRGISGHHVLTPLRIGSSTSGSCGSAIAIVDRGWVELQDDDPPVARAAPPPGEVTIDGVALTPPEPGRFSPKNLGDEPRSFRIDPAKIGERIGCPVVPLYVALNEQHPAQTGEFPIVTALDPLDRGPHFSYALQWFAFALAALGTYSAFARQALRRNRIASGP